MSVYTPKDFDPFSGFGDEARPPLSRLERNLVLFSVAVSWLALIGLVSVVRAAWRLL